MVVANVWSQDQIQRPVRASTSHENADLARYDRDQYTYVFTYFTPNGITPARMYNQTWLIDQSSDFYITSIIYAVGTDNGNVYDATAYGFLTVTDGVRNVNIVNRTWVGAFQLNNFAPGTATQNNYAQRTLWPQPYGIGAGGSLSLAIEAPQTNFGGGITAQIYIEGFKDYTIGGIRD